MPLTKNIKAIKRWVAENRPDLVEKIDEILDDNSNSQSSAAFLLLVAIGFESGRKFQNENPNQPLNVPLVYLN